MMQSQVMVETPGFLTRNNGWVRITGRLQSGVSIRQAQAAAAVVYKRHLLEQAGPHPAAEYLREIERQRLELVSAAAGYSPQWETFGRTLTILMIIAGLVLLVACANVANLLLARATARRREMAVRMAVGAGRGRIARQLLTENLVLSTLGSALGVLLAWWGASVLSTTVSLGPAQMDSRNPSQWVSLNFNLDGRILLFAAALCLLTGLLFGLAPALRGAKLASDLSGRGATGHHSRQSINLNKLLVVSQVAISLVLLAGAGLFIRTLHNLRSQDLGIQRDHVLLVWTIPGQTGRQGPAMLDFWRSVQQRISSLAGVTSAGISNQGMLSGWQPQAPGDPTLIQGETPKSISLPGGPRAYVTPHFFESVGLPLIAGREFTERDNEKAPRVVVVNESIARYYLGATNPIGRRLYAPADDPATSPWVEIVGVVKDPTAGTPRYKQAEFVWYPYRQNPHALSRMCVALHTLGDPHNLIASVRRELQAIDSSIPILRVDTVGEQLDDVLVEERIAASLAGFFGALGVVLACVGLFGLLAYSAARRTNEIGIRMAVGATRPAVIALVLREALVLAAAGIAVGVPATLIAARLISAKLYGVGPADPLTFSAAAALLLAVSALAGFLPARRASNIDPMAALRHE
jgi:predicted permease